MATGPWPFVQLVNTATQAASHKQQQHQHGRSERNVASYAGYPF